MIQVKKADKNTTIYPIVCEGCPSDKDIYEIKAIGDFGERVLWLCPKCMDELGNKILEASIEDDMEKSGILDE